MVVPGTQAVSWTVVDDTGTPVAPIEAYLSFLVSIERSPHTVRDYAVDLKVFFEFLAEGGLAYDAVRIDDLARFVAWLRAPGADLPGAVGRAPATVNQHLAAVFGMYDYLARLGVAVSADLVAWRRAGRRSYTPFLYHATKANPTKVRPMRLAVGRRSPKTLARPDILTIIRACEHLRDQFFFALLAETGLRVGQALGLRHSDIHSAARELLIVPRDNANGARPKARSVQAIPISAGLIRLYGAYMHAEYDVDSDYVFVNLFAEPKGAPLTYNAINQMVRRLRERTGIDFSAHMLRHSAATELIRSGVPIEVVSKLLTHQSSATTSAIYVHLDPADVRAGLVSAGAWDSDDDEEELEEPEEEP